MDNVVNLKEIRDIRSDSNKTTIHLCIQNIRKRLESENESNGLTECIKIVEEVFEPKTKLFAYSNLFLMGSLLHFDTCKMIEVLEYMH